MTGYYLSAFAAFAALFAAGVAIYIKADKHIGIVFKTVSIAFAATYIIRYCSGSDNIFGILAPAVSRGFSSRAQIGFALFEIQTMFASELILFLYPFFVKRVRAFDTIAACTLVFFAICFGGLRVHILAVDGEKALSAMTPRGVLVAAETGWGLAYSALVVARRIYSAIKKRASTPATSVSTAESASTLESVDRSSPTSVATIVTPADGARVSAETAGDGAIVETAAAERSVGKVKRLIFAAKNAVKRANLSWVWYVLAWAGILLATVPYYAPEALINPVSYGMKVVDRNFYHRMYLYPATIIPIALYLILKDKPPETCRAVLLFYSLAALNSFVLTHKPIDYQGDNWVTTLPLHLCNTALYITPLCLTFKLKRVFYFTYFINVLGAAIALTMPSYGTDGINGSLIVHDTISFFLSHYQAFFMPLLSVGLGIFVRPGIREFRYSLVGFAAYYLLMLALNGWFANYNPDVDYFFINSDFVADKLGDWARTLRNVVWSFSIGDLHFTYYPVYQSLFFLVYAAITLGMWFIYEISYNVIAGWNDLARRNKAFKADRLALEVASAGRNKQDPMDIENTDSLILDGFTKRYGKSDVYAVKDACLTVRGGEIFGFLGPNGAGKSTIINSIVGIQTITDGRISVCGYDVKTQSVEAKKRIGFVPDHYALYEQLTAREYINYIADLYEVSQVDRDERLARFIELFEFQTAIDNRIKTYSHGMKQKVTIMAALIHDPKVWILDEPLTGLDPNSIYQVKECMKRHAAEGNIVFFSSHIIDVVERICHRVAIIRKGQIQCVKDVEEIEAGGGSLEQFYMSVINGSDVQPVAVDGTSDCPNDDAPTKRRLFGGKNKNKEDKKDKPKQ